jgi:hypothetical protein
MRGLEELVFSVTNMCPARCKDCPIVHENKPPYALTAEDMIKIIEEILPWHTVKLIVFTGGEPFLFVEEIKKTIAFAATNHILTRIVTNAYWATSKSKALEILGELKNAGLTELNFSCDDYHQEYISLENIKNANEAAIEIGIPALLAMRTVPNGKITPEYLSDYLGEKLQEFKRGEKNNPKNNVYLNGINIPIKSHDMVCDGEFESGWKGPCPLVLSKMIISPDKYLEICCGIASSSIEDFRIGSLQESSLLQLLEKGNEDLITNWLALEGPSSILEFVHSKDPRIDLPVRYANRCHLCDELFTRSDVRNTLLKYAFEKVETISIMRAIFELANETDFVSSCGSQN